MRDSDYEFIRKLVYERSRINLGSDKRELVTARLGKRLRATKIASINEYCDFLRTDSAEEEVGNLIDAISTNHTFFFREIHHFDFLRNTVIPEMSARRREEHWRAFRIWSAASSSGEEPYSLAIETAEALPKSAPDWDWEIEATDISRRILDKARAGIYRDEAISGHVSPELIRKYFQKGFGPQEGNFRIKPVVQNQVNFSYLNLIGDAFPFSEPFQIVVCRNVMIYFDRPTQEELVNKLSRHIVPGGYLFVGHSESLTGIRHSLTMVKPAIYRRPPGARP